MIFDSSTLSRIILLLFPTLIISMANQPSSRILEEEMKKLNDLTDKLLATRILDHEVYGPKIQQNFQHVKEAMMSFVRTLYYIQIGHSQLKMAITI